KEKGNSEEKNKMYQEHPGNKLMCNTLKARYETHPIRVDIASSVESIYEITKDDLYLFYETFYHPSNMVLFVVGDVDAEHIYEVIAEHENKRDKVNQPQIVRDALNEKSEVNEFNVTESMKLQSPRLMLGFKNETLKNEPNEAYVRRDLEMTLFYEMVVGEETDFYQTLLNQDLIDETFGYQ
ncbi:insulinase family protein, partial [Mammaliicoccus fleurettii]